ncbi:MAG: GNAT family N-acetyltransferase [Spirochaetales bacterium]|nr:GNAT family N-acetyltransferase [Spirochaetales bacterium]
MTPTVIRHLDGEMERRIEANPLLNIDTFIIPSPYINDATAAKDFEHSYVWVEEGEILGYLLTYASEDRQEFLVYKIVTSPYGRGRGIGTAFLERLAQEVPQGARIYLYVWEKQYDTLEFFRKKGFEAEESIVYRNMMYHRLAVSQGGMLRRTPGESPRSPLGDEIGKTRHDARKAVRSLLAMVNALAPENAGRIIEEINRETTTLTNMLNMYRDSMALDHEVNLQDLVLDRLVPYVESCREKSAMHLEFSAEKPVVLGHWLGIGRALVNLASNALDAIHESGRDGELTLRLLADGDSHVVLSLADNGVGIPLDMQELGEDGRPRFVGRSSKGDGEGLGTAQIWSTFGPRRISFSSVPGEGTEWRIRFERSARGLSKGFVSLQRRFHELRDLAKEVTLTDKTPRNKVIASIWQLRKRELFLFELIERFSLRHNIRDIYRVVLAYLYGSMDETAFQQSVSQWTGEHPALNGWLMATANRVQERNQELSSSIDERLYRGALLKSYGQSLERVIIFTLDVGSGRFLATDRKLAEHLDFVPYLGGERTGMLRGEFVGDVNVDANPMYLGVWSVDSDEDLKQKLRLLRDGVRVLLDYGIHPSKKLAFYPTTYVRHQRDVDSDASTTFGDFAYLADWDLQNFTRETEDEGEGFLPALD